MKKAKKPFNVDEHLKMIADLAKNAPEPEEILAEFARGDYSSLDPEFLKQSSNKKERKRKHSKKPEREASL